MPFIVVLNEDSDGWPGWLDRGSHFRHTTPDGVRGVYEIMARRYDGLCRSIQAKRIAVDQELPL